MKANVKKQCRGNVEDRGMILLVVLVIVSLLALLGTTFAYRMRADLSAINATSNEFQANLAAEAGVERSKLLLRKAKLPRGVERADNERWDDNPDALRRIIVWTPGQIGGKTSLDQNVPAGEPAWRFTVVAPLIDEGRRTTEQTRFRYGIVDEASKLNLNTATRDQLVAFFRACHVEQLQSRDIASDLPERLADCLLDWREPGEVPRERGAKTSYYQTLTPKYKCKGGPLESVEELLLIKNFNGRILYGEDYNRNGHLDPNEDDGNEGLFPPDNQDGILNRGIYPYVTVYSRDTDTACDNRPRLNINNLDLNRLPEELKVQLEQEIRPEVFEFIRTAKSKKHTFKSLGELLLPLRIVTKKPQPGTQPSGRREVAPGAEEPGGPGTADDRTDGPGEPPADAPQNFDGDVDLPVPPSSSGVGRGGRPGRQDGGPRGGPDRGNQGPRQGRQPSGGGSEGEMRGGQRVPTLEDLGVDANGNKIQRRQQSNRGGGEMRGGQRVPTVEDLRALRPDLFDGTQPEEPAEAQGGPRGGPGGDRRGDRTGGGRGQGRDSGRSGDREGRDGGAPSGPGGRDRSGSREDGVLAPPRDTARPPGGSPRNQGGGKAGGEEEEEVVEEIPTPVEPGDMPAIMDRFTVASSRDGRNPMQGLINVNTASREVLLSLTELTEQDVDAILATRLTLDDESKKTPAWLATREVISREKFAAIAPRITARSLQYTVESIGFADHVGAYKRLQVILEMRGQVEQVLLWRDISSLGAGYPLREEDKDEFKHGTSGGS